MDLLQLEHFLAVVEERTFTRAAERVCRTQPAVSQSIKKLEEEVGAPLFARDVHEVSLTEAGPRARRLRSPHGAPARRGAAAGDRAQVAQGRHARHRRARVGRRLSAAGAAQSYLQKFPDIKVGIYRSRLNEIPRQVMDREVDVGFVKDEPAFHELQWVDVHSDEMMCIASPRHPLAAKTEVRIRDLGVGAVRAPSSLQHDRGDDPAALRAERHPLPDRRRAVEFREHQELRPGRSRLAFVPGITVRQELRDGTLVRIPLRELALPRRTLMIYRDQGYVSDTARELIKIVRAFNWDQGFNDKQALRSRSRRSNRRSCVTASGATPSASAIRR